MRIVSTVVPPRPDAGEDKLRFILSTNGTYTVKQAYKHLRGTTDTVQTSSVQLWKLIWRQGHAVPRVRLFVWRLLQNGLPLNRIIASRTSKGLPDCASCSQGDEDPLHMMFTCPFARSCWFGSPLAVRADALSTDGTIQTSFLNLAESLDSADWTTALNLCWAIWRS